MDAKTPSKKQPASTDMYANYKKKALKNAKEGEVVTRFPPEPSGYLHVGHVKAAMLNYHYAKMFGGKMLLRFDDTNPQAEKVEFVENIKNDLKTLDIVPDAVSHTSDHFDKIIALMKKLISDGNAYADNSDGAEMKNQRDNGIESPHRANTVQFNLKIFDEMLAGNTTEWLKDENNQLKKWCIRAKMNMQDKFKCLRDPVFFRCQMEIPHHKTGTKYKAYPTYDFACPVVDSLEGVTHALRSAEYTDRSNGYSWVQNKLDLRPVAIAEFARLNFKSTCLSKRKLKWIIEQDLVDGWNDPRFPTVQGIMRHGMEVRALTNFMLENGASKKDVNMEWDKIWAINKDLIDPVVPRYTAIAQGTSAQLVLTNGPAENYFETQPLHPKNADVGTKPLEYGSVLYLEKADAESVAVGEKITLMKWGNAVVTKKEEKGGALTLTADLNLEDKVVKGTKKITWVAKSATNLIVNIRELDHIITKERIEEEDDIAEIVNRNSSIIYPAIAEGNMRVLKKGAKLQLERRGYFQVDNVEQPNGKPMTLIFVPDGKQKNMSIVSSAIDQKQLAVGLKKNKGGDAAAKTPAETAEGADGEKTLSKKELNKLKRKEKQTAAKAATNTGGDKSKGPDGASGAASNAIVASADMTYNTIAADLSQALGFCEQALLTKQYLSGDRLSSLDKEYHDKIQPYYAQISPMTHPYTFGWFGFVSKFTEAARATWPKAAAEGGAPAQKGGKAAGGAKGGKKKKEEEEVDVDDLFGDDDPADAEAAKKVAADQKAKAAKKKKVVIAMSIVLLEVKPIDDKTNLDTLAQRMFKEITQDGLFWKTEYKKEPVAFGIFKLIVGFSLEDEKVSVDDIVEKIEAMDDMVQSVEIQAFNKI